MIQNQKHPHRIVASPSTLPFLLLLSSLKMAFAKFAKALPPSLSLAGQTAIVTGASSGIGRQSALHLARAGASVLCSDLRPTPNDSHLHQGTSTARQEPTHELINRLGGKAIFQEADVRNETDWNSSIEQAIKLSDQNRLDILLNNAGLTVFSPEGIAGESMEIFQTIFDINVKGSFLGMKVAVKQMLKQEPRPLPADCEEQLDDIERSDNQAEPAKVSFSAPESGTGGDPTIVPKPGRGSRGSIIQIGSIHGLIGGPNEPAYCSAKGATINLVRQVAFEYAPERINVNCICPGYVATSMTASVSPELNAIRPTYWPHRGSPRDVAKAVMYFARDAPWSTGTIMTVDGGTTCR